MDNWNLKLVDKFKAHGGNIVVNSKFEALLPKFIKLDESSHSDSYKVATFIRNKYVESLTISIYLHHMIILMTPLSFH